MTQGVSLYGATGESGSPLGTPLNPLIVSAGTMVRAAAVSAVGGDGVLVSGVTTAGTVILGLAKGGSITVAVPLGSTQLNYSVISAALGTAVGGTFQSTFLS